MTGSTRIRRLKIPRHYFVFIFVLFCFLFGGTGSARKRKMKISRHYFVFVFVYIWFSLYLLYYARDSCKKVTRKNRQAKSDFQNGQFQKFLVTILFFSSFFLLWRDWVCLDRTAEYFSSLFCFSSFSSFFSLYLLYYAQDSCKKWRENEDKLGPISGMDSCKNFLSRHVLVVFLNILLRYLFKKSYEWTGNRDLTPQESSFLHCRQ